MSTRRKPGEGTVRTLTSGRHQPGITLASGRRQWSRETFATREEADAALLALRAVVADLPVGGATFAAYGRTVLDTAERKKLYAPQTITSYRTRFATLCAAQWSEWPMRAVTVHAFQKHMDAIDADLSRSSAVIALSVARIVFRAAMRDRLISSDPTAGYKFPRRRRSAADEESRSFFTREQFDALLSVATPAEACMMRFAIGTGLRVGELATLHLRDVHADDERPHIVVRYGGRHGGTLQKPKSGKTRTVPLIGLAADAVAEWMRDHLPGAPNAAGLMFPAPDGGYRTIPRFLYGKRRGVLRWQQLLAAAHLSDVRPPLVWHSFRHTAATWLLSGLFGHKWQPDEVQRVLGHVSIATTLGYARIVDERLAETAARTVHGDDHAIATEHENTVRRAVGRGKKNFPETGEWSRAVRSASEQAVIAIARGEFDAAEALARVVLAHPMVMLAVAVLDGGPFAATRALELVRVLDVGDEQRGRPSATAGGAGGPSTVTGGW